MDPVLRTSTSHSISVLFPQTEARSFHLPEARAGSKTDTEFAVNPGHGPGVAPHSTEPGQASPEGTTCQGYFL